MQGWALKETREKQLAWLVCLGLVGAVFGLYALTLTRFYHGDAIHHAAVVEGLRPHTNYFRPGHLLLFPLFESWYSLWRFFGYTGRAIVSLQWLNVIAGALAVGFIWASLQCVWRKISVTLPLALFAGGGFGLWWVSVDAHGYSIPVLCLCVALWLLMRETSNCKPRSPLFVGLSVGFLHALATLIHQMAALAGPGILLFLLLVHRRRSWRMRASAAYVLVGMLVVGTTYLGIAFTTVGARSLTQFSEWLVSAKAEGPFGTPFHPGYVVPKFLRGFAQMFVWYRDESSLVGRQYLEGKISLGVALHRLNLVPLVIFWCVTLAAIAWLLIRARPVLRQRGPWLVALIVWLGTYLVFFMWWLFPDPWKWTFVLGPFLILMAVSIAELSRRASKRVNRMNRLIPAALWVLAGGCVLNNWMVRMSPESEANNNSLLQMSKKLGAEMNENDVMFSPYGRLVDYLSYFERKKGVILYYVVRSRWQKGHALTQNREQALAAIRDKVREVQRAGGRVFTEEIFHPGADDMLHPWTIYRYYFGWHEARKDMIACLSCYKPEQVPGGCGDVHVLTRSGDLSQ